MALHRDEEESEMMRKGPWTEQEDMQLMFYVNLFGDRQWDFLAKVSGLKRTGKSCRLRWVNYLHPGLKRGKITPQEQALILQLHNKWGNRWSRIARKLPGRTDNEIKNYWRTHMRKMAQKKKNKGASTTSGASSSLVTNCCSYDDVDSSSSNTSPTAVESIVHVAKDRDFYDTGGVVVNGDAPPQPSPADDVSMMKGYPMDEIWKDIELWENNSVDCVDHHKSLWEYNYCPNNDHQFYRFDNQADNIFFTAAG